MVRRTCKYGGRASSSRSPSLGLILWPDECPPVVVDSASACSESPSLRSENRECFGCGFGGVWVEGEPAVSRPKTIASHPDRGEIERGTKPTDTLRSEACARETTNGGEVQSIGCVLEVGRSGKFTRNWRCRDPLKFRVVRALGMALIKRPMALTVTRRPETFTHIYGRRTRGLHLLFFLLLIFQILIILAVESSTIWTPCQRSTGTVYLRLTEIFLREMPMSDPAEGFKSSQTYGVKWVQCCFFLL